jgi:hypothetical protein
MRVRGWAVQRSLSGGVPRCTQATSTALPQHRVRLLASLRRRSPMGSSAVGVVLAAHRARANRDAIPAGPRDLPDLVATGPARARALRVQDYGSRNGAPGPAASSSKPRRPAVRRGDSQLLRWLSARAVCPRLGRLAGHDPAWQAEAAALRQRSGGLVVRCWPRSSHRAGRRRRRAGRPPGPSQEPRRRRAGGCLLPWRAGCPHRSHSPPTAVPG